MLLATNINGHVYTYIFFVGPNDGLVSVKSSLWGTDCGIVGLDHLQQIGLGIWNDHIALYHEIINRLVKEGM
jgi:hypothetical protein